VGGLLGVRLSGEVAFGVEVSQDRKHAAVVAAGRDGESGKILVDLAPYYDHPRGVVARLDVLYMRHDPVAVVLDPRSQAATLTGPLAEAGIVVTRASAEDVAVAHGEFLDLVNDQQMIHLDQPPLTMAVRAAQQRPLAGALALERKVAVDQSPLVAAELAAWGYRRWEQVSQPGAWVV
jgi:hypothetical protein